MTLSCLILLVAALLAASSYEAAVTGALRDALEIDNLRNTIVTLNATSTEIRTVSVRLLRRMVLSSPSPTGGRSGSPPDSPLGLNTLQLQTTLTDLTTADTW
jgi:hypothetical protein